MIKILWVIKAVGLGSALIAQLYFTFTFWLTLHGLSVPIVFESNQIISSGELLVSLIGVLVLVWQISKMVPERVIENET